MDVINGFYNYIAENPILAYLIAIVAIVVSAILLINNARQNRR